MTTIYRALVANEDGLGLIDAIQHEGELWLVPEWFEDTAQGLIRPVRAILLKYLPHQLHFGSPMADIVVNGEVPKAALAGHPPAGDPRWVVLEAPDIQIVSRRQ